MPEAPVLPPLSRLYREHFAAAWAALRRLGVPAESLEDAVHDVFVVVHRQRDRFEGRSTVRTWILSIARRVAFNHRRTRARALQRHTALAAVTPPVRDPDDDIARQEGWRALQGFLDELDEDKRAAFVLGELERLNRRELGVALGVSPNTAWARLRAARAQFHVRFAAPSSTHALAAGRRAVPPPSESRQRVWLVLTAGLRDVAVPVASLWSVKAMLTTVGLASAVLGVVAVAVPRRPAAGEHAPTIAASIHRDGDVGISHPPRRSSAAPEAATAPVTSVDVITTQAVEASVTPTTPTTPSPASAMRTATKPVDPRARASPTSSTPTSSPPADDLAVETELMLAAQDALERGDPRAALAALEAHGRRFPHGVLAEERDVGRVRAHCAAGQHEAARREARELAVAYPRSAYLDALERSCPSSVTTLARAGDQPR